MTHSSDPVSPLPVVLWTETATAGRDGQIIDRMHADIRVTAVGGPRSGEVVALARRLNCPHDDDFRKIMLRSEARWLLTGSMQDIDHRDFAGLSHDIRIAAIEPAIDSLADPPLSSDRINYLPAMLRSPGWNLAANPDEVIAAAQVTRLTSLGRPDHCTLFARLLDGWRTLVTLHGLPETIDAALTGPLPAAPESPRGLTGHIAGMARLERSRCILFEISDRAGRHERCIQMIGRAGRLIVTDDAYELSDENGEILDGSHVGDATSQQSDFVDQVIHDWRSLLSPPANPAALNPARLLEIESHALACTLAAMLSARTSQPESPAKLLALHDPAVTAR